MWLISKTERSLNLRKLVNTGLFQITSQSTKKKKKYTQDVFHLMGPACYFPAKFSKDKLLLIRVYRLSAITLLSSAN